MAKIDFKKTLKHLYSPSSVEFETVEVPTLQFLMIDGKGDPNTTGSYQEAVEALYGTAYKIKFQSKQAGQDYVVPPLEGLWWADNLEVFTSGLDKNQWKWTMMIMTPDWVTLKDFHTAVEEVRLAKDLPALDHLYLESYEEGLSAQILHIGSYDNEGPVLKRLHEEWLPEHGFVPRGKHHEIYLSDPRRVEPERLKTILRQPIQRIK